jgi:hypothetical protein
MVAVFSPKEACCGEANITARKYRGNPTENTFGDKEKGARKSRQTQKNLETIELGGRTTRSGCLPVAKSCTVRN